MTRPYYYRIKDKETDIYYIGCKFEKGCSPETFWVDYFTSSEEIKSLDKSRFEVCKIVEMKDPLSYETKVLRKIDCASHPLFYNKHNNNWGDVHPSTLPKVQKQMTEKMTKTKNSAEWKETTGKIVSEKLSKFMKDKCSSENFEEIDKDRRNKISIWVNDSDNQQRRLKTLFKTINSDEYKNVVEPERIKKITQSQKKEGQREIVVKIRNLKNNLHYILKKRMIKELGIKTGWYRKKDEELFTLLLKMEKWIKENE